MLYTEPGTGEDSSVGHFEAIVRGTAGALSAELNSSLTSPETPDVAPKMKGGMMEETEAYLLILEAGVEDVALAQEAARRFPHDINKAVLWALANS